MKRGPSKFRIALPLACLLLGSVPARANLCDQDDIDKVAEIDATVDGQIDQASDIKAQADVLLELSEHEAEEIQGALLYNDAELQIDIERMLLTSCVESCVGQVRLPLPPAPPASGDSRCFTCANPRLMITNQNGGYLEDVLAIVEKNVEKVEEAAIGLDAATARALLDLAEQSFAAGNVEQSFSYCCQAYGTLACPARGRGRLRAPDPVAPPPAAGFAGYGRRR